VLGELQSVLSDAGLNKIVRSVTWSLNNVRYAVRRSREIAHWLDGRTGIDAFVILDDDDSAGVGFERVFVRTDGATGLQDEHVERAIAILGVA
jgi:hypothetical protein